MQLSQTRDSMDPAPESGGAVRDASGADGIHGSHTKIIRLQSFSGDVDVLTAADFAARLDKLATDEAHDYVLDLSEVEFLGTSGIALLLSFAHAGFERQAPLAVVVNGPLAHVIDTCCPGELALYDDVETAQQVVSAVLDADRQSVNGGR